MAPDTKVPDGQRQNNIPPPMAGDNNSEECLTLGKQVAGTQLLLDKRLLPLS
ncbi:hypothetical protein DPMN_112739 [Dreissena polymorpha]|uniref:Uncharacterized protein n=1 Tax=Dreissena polymorpha TaxID=45954 RepID=A0A9D4QQX7_DREPO|nr:hypothetical protein DPMN_112739 [Dreissena polymorpha]